MVCSEIKFLGRSFILITFHLSRKLSLNTEERGLKYGNNLMITIVYIVQNSEDQKHPPTLLVE